jgi:hypothetical protein
MSGRVENVERSALPFAIPDAESPLGQFELFRKGEWLTKTMSNYDNNLVGMTTVGSCAWPGRKGADLARQVGAPSVASA